MRSVEKLSAAIRAMDVGEVRLMEVCGTHTMSIAKSGIKAMLPENVKLLSGPGCPVCPCCPWSGVQSRPIKSRAGSQSDTPSSLSVLIAF